MGWGGTAFALLAVLLVNCWLGSWVPSLFEPCGLTQVGGWAGGWSGAEWWGRVVGDINGWGACERAAPGVEGSGTQRGRLDLPQHCPHACWRNGLAPSMAHLLTAAPLPPTALCR